MRAEGLEGGADGLGGEGTGGEGDEPVVLGFEADDALFDSLAPVVIVRLEALFAVAVAAEGGAEALFAGGRC